MVLISKPLTSCTLLLATLAVGACADQGGSATASTAFDGRYYGSVRVSHPDCGQDGAISLVVQGGAMTITLGAGRTVTARVAQDGAVSRLLFNDHNQQVFAIQSGGGLVTRERAQVSFDFHNASLLAVARACTYRYEAERFGTSRWPGSQAFLQAGVSRSTRAAVLPTDVRVTVPDDNVPAGLRLFSGRWTGWSGTGHRASVEIAVESLHPNGGTIAYAYSSPTSALIQHRIGVRLIDNQELEGVLPGGEIVNFRIRPDGNMDYLWRRDRSGDSSFSAWAAGVLTRRT
jgi:hypothetical protein